jgi:deoxyribose-phosphate aldolase
MSDFDIDIAPMIDHSLLVATATPEDVTRWCAEAERYNFAAVCIHPRYVRLAAELLNNKRVKVCTVIGFPTGATTSAVKLYEAQEAVDNGAEELDVVIDLGSLKAGKVDDVHADLAAICNETGKTVKAILEMSLLTPEEQRIAAEICMDAGASYLKTSTGWNGGATVADIKLLAELSKERVGIKASGGIKSHDEAIALVRAGATRLGTSRGVALLKDRDKPTRSKGDQSADADRDRENADDQY